MKKCFRDLLKKYTTDNNCLVCDLTQGDKRMSLALYTIALQLQTDYRVIYWQKQMKNRNIVPDTLELEELASL